MLANREDPARRMSTSNAQFGPVKLIENVGWVVGVSRLTYGTSVQRIGILKRQYTLVEKYRMGWSAWFER